MNRFFFFRLFIAFIYFSSTSLLGYSQSKSDQSIQVLVTPNHPNWNYALGEDASFKVAVLQNNIPVKNAKISYSIGLEKMRPMQTGEVILKDGSATVGRKIKLNDPGFLRFDAIVDIDGKQHRGLSTAAFAAESIMPTQVLPADFLQFWETEKAKASTVPIDAKITLLEDRSTENVNVYQVSIQNYELGTRLYGILATPKKEGKYPAVLQVPGAGIRPYGGIIDLAEKGIITLQIGIHGIPVNYDSNLYNNLGNGALKGYQFFNLDDRDKYYYKRVYLGCVRAVDYLFSRDEFDGKNLIVWGGSQGGALSIVTAALDNRVKGLVSLYPALSDMTGYLHGRAGGWPHMFNEQNAPFMAKEDKINASAYYDVVNFARFVTVPGFYTWGYNDETCPPTSYYAAYNQIKAPKELFVAKETGHFSIPEQRIKIQEWLLDKLVSK